MKIKLEKIIIQTIQIPIIHLKENIWLTLIHVYKWLKYFKEFKKLKLFQQYNIET